MSKTEKFFNSKLTNFVFLVLSVTAAILFRASRSNWVFINTTVGIDNLSVIILSLMVIVCLTQGLLTVIKIHRTDCEEKKGKLCHIITVLTAIISVIFFIFAIAYSAGLLLSESSQAFLLYLRKTLTEGTLLITVPFFVLIFPSLGREAKKYISKAFLIAVFLLGINSFFPFSSYKITSTPMVIDNGNEYSVVFSTSSEGTAYVEYTFNGENYKLFDNEDGRLNSNTKIHSVAVPYEHLRNNTYKVGSTRVMEEFSYGSRTGKTVTSEEYSFKYNDSKNQTWLVISDWHTMLDAAYTAIDNLKSSYDAVILLGDATPGVDFEEQVITNIIKFGGKVSNGTMPVLYVRGNHETRGAYAKDLPSALGIEQFYYTTDMGPYCFVVLDSGEDKDDSHIEYGGMNDYNTYRADMVKWLKGVNVKNKRVITLSHAWQVSTVEPELSSEAWSELDRIGTRLILSGHEHKCRLIGENNENEKAYKDKHPNIIGYIDGGKKDDDYIASLLTLSDKGFELKAVDNNNTEIFNKAFSW